MNVELLENAADSIVKMVQLKSLGEELRILSANSNSRIGVNKSLTLSWTVMVCYELVADWGNPDTLKVKLIIWFFRSKATYKKQSYDGVLKMLPMVEEE